MAAKKSLNNINKKSVNSSVSEKNKALKSKKNVSQKNGIDSLESVNKKAALIFGSTTHSNNEKTISLGELLLAVLIIGGIFLFGYRRAISIKNVAEDSAKYYKAEAMAAELDLYFSQKGQYPLESNLEDEYWVKLNPRLEVLLDDGYGNSIGSDMFKYVTYPEGCNNDTALCDGYKIDIYSTSDDQTIQQTGGSGDNYSADLQTQSEGVQDTTNSTETEEAE
ncbi:MAG TPA: hypothetical protein PKA29_02095 [Candidatus Saccharibacteria bacterium]|nr:hypothetical protein [Candidatus Saccharibacteria bacterium]